MSGFVLGALCGAGVFLFLHAYTLYGRATFVRILVQTVVGAGCVAIGASGGIYAILTA